MSTSFLAQSTVGMSNVFVIITMITIFVFFYFSMIRPRKKQQQERTKMMSELKKGDQVIMVDGLRSKVDSINDADKAVVIDTDGTFLTFEKMATRRALPTAAAPARDVKASEAKEEKVETEEKPTESSKPEETASNKTDDTNSEDK